MAVKLFFKKLYILFFTFYNDTFSILFFTFLQNKENIIIKRIEGVFRVKLSVKNLGFVKNSFLHFR